MPETEERRLFTFNVFLECCPTVRQKGSTRPPLLPLMLRRFVFGTLETNFYIACKLRETTSSKACFFSMYITFFSCVLHALPLLLSRHKNSGKCIANKRLERISSSLGLHRSCCQISIAFHITIRAAYVSDACRCFIISLPYKHWIDVLLFRRFSPINSRQVPIAAPSLLSGVARRPCWGRSSNRSTHAAFHAAVLSKSRALVGSRCCFEF